jgi:hypothetical protein
MMAASHGDAAVQYLVVWSINVSCTGTYVFEDEDNVIAW